MDKEQKNDSASVDRTINTYILKTYTLYEKVYTFTVDGDLLNKNPEQFQESIKLMSAINEWQLKMDAQHKTYESGFTEINLLESEQYKKLVDEFIVKTCREILNIDPDNKQAKETIDKLYYRK